MWAHHTPFVFIAFVRVSVPHAFVTAAVITAALRLGDFGARGRCLVVVCASACKPHVHDSGRRLHGTRNTHEARV